MNILIIEDDARIVEAIRILIEMRWPEAEVTSCAEGSAGLDLLLHGKPDMVLLDLNLPDLDGLDVLKDLRNFSNVPVIILTVRGNEIDKVRGLELGADDYVTKPFSHSELLARMRAVLRRANPGVEAEAISLGDLVLDVSRRSVHLRGQEIALTPTEFGLFHYLAINEGRPLTTEMLLRKVWGPQYVDAHEYIKVYIRRLREKLEPDPEHPQMLLSLRGRGYMFVRPH